MIPREILEGGKREKQKKIKKSQDERLRDKRERRTLKSVLQLVVPFSSSFLVSSRSHFTFYRGIRDNDCKTTNRMATLASLAIESMVKLCAS